LVNKKKPAYLALLLAAAIGLTACSSSAAPGDENPKDVRAELATDPAQPQAGQPTKLTATVTGLKDEKKAIVQFEIRRSDNKTLPDLTEEATYSGKGTYSAEYSFKEQAKYDVYIHIYRGELHVTKKKPVEVGP